MVGLNASPCEEELENDRVLVLCYSFVCCCCVPVAINNITYITIKITTSFELLTANLLNCLNELVFAVFSTNVISLLFCFVRLSVMVGMSSM
jgi:hypothetical protein